MAFSTLKFGSRGDEVKKLQTALNSKGASLSVDGIFGKNTLKAVKNYQSSNNIGIDGVAGANTLNSLYGNTNTGSTGGKTANTPTKPQTTSEWLKYYESGNDEPYKSPYSADIESALDAWKNRSDFTYDFNTDPVYQQYREQYSANGEKAMQDTVANASALTGGYGNSYAQQVGQQAYGDYLSKLNDIIPALQQNAYTKYANENDKLYQELSALLSLDDTSYNRYRNDVSDRYTNREYYYNKLADEIAASQASSSGGSGGSGSPSNPQLTDAESNPYGEHYTKYKSLTNLKNNLDNFLKVGMSAKSLANILEYEQTGTYTYLTRPEMKSLQKEYEEKLKKAQPGQYTGSVNNPHS